MQACLADPEQAAPCTIVDPARGFVVIKDDDRAKPDAWLIVPSTEVTGIEDPAVLRGAGRGLLGGRLAGRPPVWCRHRRRDWASRSTPWPGRSQNLLHIHISCVLPAVRAALAAAAIGPDWAEAPFLTLAGQRFNARRGGAAGAEPVPAAARPARRGARNGRAVAGVIGAADGGYVVLTDSTEPGVVAETEALLDETCRG